MSSKELKVVLSANVSQFKSAMQSISSEMKSVTSNTKQFATDVGKGLQDVGKKMTLVGVGIVASIGGIETDMEQKTIIVQIEICGE